MAKTAVIWECQSCGKKAAQWVGCCPSCKAWNSYEKGLETKEQAERYQTKRSHSKPLRLKDVNVEQTPRIRTRLKEFDQVLGGGIVPGSLTLLGGDPGIGKSTLLLQSCFALAKQGARVLYVSGEESLAQIKMRAVRLNVDSDNLLLLSETQVLSIVQQVKELKPHVVVIDSIQIVYKPEIPSSPGSVTQLREATAEFLHLAKGTQTSIFLIGHVTKAGDIAGPRILEHMVDTVLYFEGDKQLRYRLLRVIKNRFGPCDEIAVFQMEEAGLKEVDNPSSLFLKERQEGQNGSVIVPLLEGSRGMLVEVQALANKSFFPQPTRKSSGIDANRLSLLLAVLDKRLKFQLHACDIFVSAAGGIRIQEPASDLGIALAIGSSIANQSIDPETLVVGEVGLGGEVRSVPRLDLRLKEAALMGFRRCLVPKSAMKGMASTYEVGKTQVQLVGIEFVEEAFDLLLR